jgi:hypothetical protein
MPACIRQPFNALWPAMTLAHPYDSDTDSAEYLQEGCM